MSKYIKVGGSSGSGGSSTFDGLSDKASVDLPGINAPLANALGGKARTTDVANHTSNTANPHSVTKTQVGLSNVDNTSDINKPISTATQTALNAKEVSTNKKTDVDANKTSNVFFPSVKAVFDWVSGLFVKGAASSTDNAIARFDGTTGKLVKNSALTVDDDGKFELDGRISSAYINLQSEEFLDTGMIGGLFDRCETTNSHIFGSLTTSVSSGTLADGSSVVDGIAGTIATITGVTPSTSMTIIIDMLSNVPNYNRAKWMPFVSFRGSNTNFFRDIVVSVSTNGTTWYTGALWQISGFGTANRQFPYWFGGEYYPAPLATWRYVKFELSNPLNTTPLYISQVGMRHVNAPYLSRNVVLTKVKIGSQIIDNVGSSGTDGQVLKKVGGQVLWSNP